MKVALITPYKKKDGLIPVIVEGLYDHGVEVIASDPGNGVRPEDVRSEGEFVSYARAADFIFVLWGKGPDSRWPGSYVNRFPKYHLLDEINRPGKTIYVDGSEWTHTGHPETFEMVDNPFSGGRKIPIQALEAKLDPSRYRGEPWINEGMLKKCKWYFKRECYPQDVERGIIPLTFGCEKKFFGEMNHPKKTDIICSFGQIYTGLRVEVQAICENLKSEGFSVKVVKGLNYQDYLKEISSAYISVSAWGGGNCCMRMWESMANKTCCFVQKPQIVFPNIPQDGRHYVEYSTPKEFEIKIREYLKNKEKCVQVGRNGYDFVKDSHTGISRVKYIFNIIKT